MSLSIKQDSEYAGHNRWKWSLWLDGPSSELDQVDHVMYVLHPTFHDPVRKVTDRSTNFRLETSGWGTFTVYARAVFQDGHEQPLEHELELAYPDSPTRA